MISDKINIFANNNDLISCYQMQIKHDKCVPVFIGQYKTLPVPTHKIIKHNKYYLHVITYILTDEEIKNKIYKIVGIVVFRNLNEKSFCSIDLILAPTTEEYQLIYNNHRKFTTKIISSIDFPKYNLIDFIINKAFEILKKYNI